MLRLTPSRSTPIFYACQGISNKILPTCFGILYFSKFRVSFRFNNTNSVATYRMNDSLKSLISEASDSAPVST